MTTMRPLIVCLFLYQTLNLCCSSSIQRNDLQTDDVLNEKVESMKRECECPKFPRPVDCSEVLANGRNVSGVYTVHPRSRVVDCESLRVYCDMDTDGGGWTVIQRRGDYKNGENYFVKNWQSFKKGFGNIQKEFWLGNDNIHALTNQDSYSLRIDMRRTNGDAAFALHDTFYIEDETQNYKLYLQEYSGTSGDAISRHHLALFYTLDRPNWTPGRKQGDKMHQGGWWGNSFPTTNLNGLNKQGLDKSGGQQGIVWSTFGAPNYLESLAATEMKVRPRRFN